MEEEGLVEACRAAMKALEGAKEETGKAVVRVRAEEATAKAATARVVGAMAVVAVAVEARDTAMAEAAASRTLPPTPPTLGCLRQSSLQKSLPSDMHRSTDTTWQTLARLKQYQIQSSPQSRRHSPRWCWSSP